MFQFYYFLTKFFNQILICDDKGIKKQLATCILMCVKKNATEYHWYFDFYIHIFKKKNLCLLFSRFSFFCIIIIEFQHQTNL